MALISILHDRTNLPKAYIISALIPYWQNSGHTIRNGRHFLPEADVSLLHIDRTFIKPADIPQHPPNARLLNHRVLDISKRQVSSHLVTPNSDWDQPVIIKSNLNHFGNPERKGQKPGLGSRMRGRLAEYSWRLARQLPFKTYPVVPHLRHVPGWVWDHPDLVVEKFLPEREGDHYCLRGWMFLGNKSYGWRMYGTDPMVKVSNKVRHEFSDEIPSVLEAYRAARGYDFGKFDYVVHAGEVILLDANKTPGFSGERKSSRLQNLASGIEEYL